jgi:hypothetical protein
MRVVYMFTASVAASLILSAVADASDAPGRADGNTGNGKSEVVNSTGLPWNVQGVQRVSPVGAWHYPEFDWNSASGPAERRLLRVVSRPCIQSRQQVHSGIPILIGLLRFGAGRGGGSRAGGSTY